MYLCKLTGVSVVSLTYLCFCFFFTCFSACHLRSSNHATVLSLPWYLKLKEKLPWIQFTLYHFFFLPPVFPYQLFSFLCFLFTRVDMRGNELNWAVVLPLCVWDYFWRLFTISRLFLIDPRMIKALEVHGSLVHFTVVQWSFLSGIYIFIIPLKRSKLSIHVCMMMGLSLRFSISFPMKAVVSEYRSLLYRHWSIDGLK